MTRDPNAKAQPPLLGAVDPSPVFVMNPAGAANILLIGDHAGNAIPRTLGDLGISRTDRERHIAWDLGVLWLGEELASMLDATFVAQRFSRLVIDCNRDPGSPAAIVEVSDETPIPGNIALSAADREQRRIAIHEPYHRQIASEITSRRVRGRSPTLVALHSFTPSIGGRSRPWHLGVLHDAGDTRLSHAMLDRLRQEKDLAVGDNEPYRMDGTDYTIPRHAYPVPAPYLEVEFRQDLLFDRAACSRWAERLARWLPEAVATLSDQPGAP